MGYGNKLRDIKKNKKFKNNLIKIVMSYHENRNNVLEKKSIMNNWFE